MDLLILIGCALALLFCYSIMNSVLVIRHFRLYKKSDVPLNLDVGTIYDVAVWGISVPCLLTFIGVKRSEDKKIIEVEFREDSDQRDILLP